MLQALQLLEYLVKNGSERVVDDARSHIATIKMLRNFYYIDEKGKDQGLNGMVYINSISCGTHLRQSVTVLRSWSICSVMSRRSVLKDAKPRRTKANIPESEVTEVSASTPVGVVMAVLAAKLRATEDQVAAMVEITAEEVCPTAIFSPIGVTYARSDYGDYSSGGGSGGFRDSTSRKTYDEYDAGDDDVVSSRRSNSISTRPSASSPAPRRSATAPVTPVTTAKAKAPEPVPDLLGLDDDDFAAPVAAAPAIPAPVATTSLDGTCQIYILCYLG